MRIKIYTIILFLIFFACSKKNKESNPVPSDPPVGNKCFLKNYVGVKDAQLLIAEYKYNQKQQLDEETIVAPNDLQYSKKKYFYYKDGSRASLITEFYARDQPTDPFKFINSIERTYEYSLEGRLIKATDSKGSNPYLTVEYNQQGQLFKIISSIENSTYLFLTYDDNGDMIQVEQVDQNDPTKRKLVAKFEYDLSRPAQVLPEYREVVYGLDFLILKHFCKRVYYYNIDDSKQFNYVDFTVYKREDAGQPEWDWIDVKWNLSTSKNTYSLAYECF